MSTKMSWALTFPKSKPENERDAESWDFAGTSASENVKEFFRTLEYGHSIHHQSIPHYLPALQPPYRAPKREIRKKAIFETKEIDFWGTPSDPFK